MSKVSILLAVVLTTIGVGEASAQCNNGVCQARTVTVTRPVVRLQSVCATNFRGCPVQRVRPVVVCQTRTRTRLLRRRRSCCNQCNSCGQSGTPTEAAYQVAPQTIVVEPVADPSGQIQVVPNQPVAPPQPKTDTSAKAPVDLLDLSDSTQDSIDTVKLSSPFTEAKANSPN